MADKLTPKQAAFVREYLTDRNGTQAAIRAGYSKKTAEQGAAQLLSNIKVKNAVKVGTQKHAAKCEVTRESLMKEYEADRKLARELENPQIAAAISATNHIAKMFGLEGKTLIDVTTANQPINLWGGREPTSK